MFDIRDKRLIISDWYMPYDSYDESIRGEAGNKSGLGNPLVAEKQREYHDKISDCFSSN